MDLRLDGHLREQARGANIVGVNENDMQAQITQNVLSLLGPRGYASRTALGKRIGKDESALSKRISGASRWTLADVAKLGEALGVPAGWLLSPLTVVIEATGTGGPAQVTVRPSPHAVDHMPFMQTSIDWESPAKSPVAVASPQVARLVPLPASASPTVTPFRVLPVTDLATERVSRRGPGTAHSALSRAM